jgi:uncharacterized protein (DUF1778 family)
VTLRVSGQQRELWQEAADREGLSLSGWMRKRCEVENIQARRNDGPSRKSAAQRLAEILEQVNQ